LTLLAGGLASCSTDFEVFTDAKEAYVVYGVLNPTQDTQFVKITRVFQTDGDAVAYAEANDPTVASLDVRLVGDSAIWPAVVVRDHPRDPGLFMPGQAIYAFPSTGGSVLEPGERYTLEIRKPDDPNFLITATTQVPLQPTIRSPRGPYTGVGGRFTWPTLDFENDLTVEYNQGDAAAWELRIGFKYLKDSVPQESKMKLRGILLPEEGCAADPPLMCYPIEAYVFPRWILSLTEFSVGEIQYTDEPRVVSTIDSLPQVCYLEVTAIDSQLTLFLRGNDPGEFGINLLMDKQEYSNISGDHYGIFGSINTDLSWIYMSQCTQYLGGLTSAMPPGCSF
jgi:hypothetical protein